MQTSVGKKAEKRLAALQNILQGANNFCRKNICLKLG
jgi:hypothetical protein